MFQAFLKSLTVFFFSPPSSNLVPKTINLFLEIIYLFVVFWVYLFFLFVLHTEILRPKQTVLQKNAVRQPSFEGSVPDNFLAPERSSGGWGH